MESRPEHPLAHILKTKEYHARRALAVNLDFDVVTLGETSNDFVKVNRQALLNLLNDYLLLRDKTENL